MAEENHSPRAEDVKKENDQEDGEEATDSEDLQSIDRSFDNELEEISSIKNEPADKDLSENAKSDDDMQGYDTRSEVASSVTSDSDSGDGVSSKSFDVKRKRRDKPLLSQLSSSQEKHRKNDSISPLKRNSSEYIGKLNYLFRDARFFIIKSSNAENIALSKIKGVWATLPQNQVKLSEAFRNSGNVILIFSAKESGKFSGFARLATGVDRSISPVPWIVPAELTLNLLKGTFRIDWICKRDLPFSFTTTLYNPWNCNKPVKIARDGQEIEPRIGEKLCRLFPEDVEVDITPVLRKSKEASKNRRTQDSSKSLYTSKYRSKILQNHKSKDRKPLMNRTRDGGRITKHYKNRPINMPKNFPDMNKAPFRGRVMTSIETYVKRFSHSLRPPMPVSLPFLHPPPHGEMFAPHFGHLPLPQPPILPRYYDPVPSFPPHFPKMNHLPPNKHLYDRSVEEFLRKTRETNFHPGKKENRTRRKENDGRAKRGQYRDKYRNFK